MHMISLNQSKKSIHLEFLPPEIQCQILKSIPNMKALQALLRASPRYFQVHKTSPRAFLSHVAWNQISPDVVPIALKALERRDNSTPPFASQRKVKGPHEIPYEIWKRLLCLHEMVESLISGFTSSPLVALETSIHPQTQSLSHESSSPELNLSHVEYARLARAFYHLDLYENLFHGLGTSALSQNFYQIPERATIFLQRLQDWELEELLCVRSYMIERVKDFLNKFGDDFMESFLKDKPFILLATHISTPFDARTDLLPCVPHDPLCALLLRAGSTCPGDRIISTETIVMG